MKRGLSKLVAVSLHLFHEITFFLAGIKEGVIVRNGTAEEDEAGDGEIEKRKGKRRSRKSKGMRETERERETKNQF